MNLVDTTTHAWDIANANQQVGWPTPPFQLIAWFIWATAVLNHRWTNPDEVPGDVTLPAWDWEGTEGW